MQQVLEAPSLQADIREPIAIDDGDRAAEPTPQPITLRRAIMSAFKRSKPQHLPTCANTKTTHEAALDRICRIDPYLYIRAMAG